MCVCVRPFFRSKKAPAIQFSCSTFCLGIFLSYIIFHKLPLTTHTLTHTSIELSAEGFHVINFYCSLLSYTGVENEEKFVPLSSFSFTRSFTPPFILLDSMLLLSSSESSYTFIYMSTCHSLSLSLFCALLGRRLRKKYAIIFMRLNKLDSFFFGAN